jgi:hypothetical protein
MTATGSRILPSAHSTAAKGGFLSFFDTTRPSKLMQKIHRLTDN